MNVSELKKQLKAKNIREDMYCLNGGFPNESYRLKSVGSGLGSLL